MQRVMSRGHRLRRSNQYGRVVEKTNDKYEKVVNPSK